MLRLALSQGLAGEAARQQVRLVVAAGHRLVVVVAGGMHDAVVHGDSVGTRSSECGATGDWKCAPRDGVRQLPQQVIAAGQKLVQCSLVEPVRGVEAGDVEQAQAA